MHINVHRTATGVIIAACDKKLIGKVLKDGDVELDLKMHAKFYGEPGTIKELTRLLEGDFDSVNLVGEKAVSVAIKTGIVGQKDVKHIKNIPYLQIYSI